MKPSWADIVEGGRDELGGINLPWLDEQDGYSSDGSEPLPMSWAQVVAGESAYTGLPGQGLDGATLSSPGVASRAVCKPEPGEPVGIRAVQSILMLATQTNLSHFHTAGMDTSNLATGPSAAEAMDSLYTKHNTSMKFDTSASVEDLRRSMVGANLGTFVTTLGSNSTILPERENVWYEVLGIPFNRSVLRLYINYRMMRDHGLTLDTLAREAFGNDCSWRVSPDFMGMIDVDVKDLFMFTWLSRLDLRVCGTQDVVSCNVVNGSTAITRGTNVLAASRTPGVHKRTIVSNNVTEVQKMFGIEAAAGVLTGLIGSRTVSDFMARTGKILPFNKRSKELENKGMLTSMGLERPKDDIIRYATASAPRAKSLQVNECIMTGRDPFPGFDVIT